MSSPFDKFKEILAIATPIAKPFIPGGAGTVLDQVNQVLKPGNASPDATKAIQALASRVDAYNDQQDQAILSLHERLKKAGF